ncbi:tetratricopeptide repeat protein [Nostoc sp. FACHB-190]|nr:tetratricopeptide repeat protein [Nostoc sp. FACHB-190]
MQFPALRMPTLAVLLVIFSIDSGLMNDHPRQGRVLAAELIANHQVVAQIPEAQQLFEQGNQQLAQSQFTSALQSFQQALNIYQAIGDRTHTAAVLNKLGEVYRHQGQIQTALQHHQQAWEITRELNNRAEEAASLHQIAAVYATQGQYKNAVQFYQQALSIWREVKDKSGEAMTLIGLGNTYVSYIKLQLYYQQIKKPEEIKSYLEVRKYYQQALMIMGALGDRAGVGWSLNGIGMTYAALNQKEQAVKYYEQALAQMRQAGDRIGEATVMLNLSKDYNWGIDNQRESRPISLDFSEPALAIVREIGDRPLTAKILNAIASTYKNTFTHKNKGGQPQIALEYYQQALPIAREIGDRSLEEKILNNLGYIYHTQGYPQTAQEYQEQALAIRQEMGVHVGWATNIVKQAILVTYNIPQKRPTLITLLTGEALIHYRNGAEHAKFARYPAALASYQQALAIVRQQKNRPWEWVILNQMGTIYETLGQLQVALDTYQQSLVIRREVAEQSTKTPIPHTIRVAFGTDVNIHSPEGIKLEDGLSNGLIQVGKGKPIKTAITTVESAEIAEIEKRGQRLEVIAGVAGWQNFAENEEENTLANIADIHKTLGQYQTALQFYKEALAIINAEMSSPENIEVRRRREELSPGDYRQQEQRIKRSMGEVYAALGQYQTALDDYQQSLAIVNMENSSHRLVNQKPILLTQIGEIYTNLGQYEAALTAYQQALAIARDPQTQDNYFVPEQQIRQFGQQELFRWTRIPFEKPDQAAILNSIAAIYAKLGQTQTAQEYREQASTLQREISNRNLENITGQKAVLITEVGRDAAKKTLVQVHPLEGEAVVLFAKGNSYATQGQYLKTQLQAALQAYQQALTIVRQQKNRPWEGIILTQMSAVYKQLGENQAATQVDQQALAIRQEIAKQSEKTATILGKTPLSGTFEGEKLEIRLSSGKITTFNPAGGVIFFAQTPEKLKADQLYEAGWRQYIKREYARAIKTFEAALLIYQQIEDKTGTGRTLFHLGDVYHRQRNYQQALKYYQQALAIQQEIGDRGWEKSSLNSIADIYTIQGNEFSRAGKYREALEKYQQVLEIAKKLGSEPRQWPTFHRIARVYSSLGEYKLALDYYQKALPIRQEILGNWVGIEFDMGQIYKVLGQYELALKSYQEALKIARQPVLLESDGNRIGDIAGEVRALNAIGNIHYRQEKYELALDFHQQALTVLQKIQNKEQQEFLKATTYYNIGIVYFKQEKYQLALAYLQPPLTIYQKFKSRNAEGINLHAIGNVYLEQGQYELAGKFLHQSLVIAQEIGNKEGEGYILNTIGKLLEKQNQPELAIIFFKQSVNARETIRNNIRELSKEQQQSYTETIAKDYRHLADILLQRNRILEAQQVLDLLKVQEIDDYLRDVRGSEKTATGVVERPQERQIRAVMQAEFEQAIALGRELAQLENISVSSRTPSQKQRILELRKIQQTLAKDFNTFLDSPKVREWVAQLQQTTQGQSFNLESSASALQDNLKKLQQGAVILYPLVLSDRLELVLVTPYAPPIRRTVAVTQEELNRAILEFRTTLPKRTPKITVPAQKLYDLLIKPLENDLAQAQAQTIIYAPDGQLRYVPLAALYDGQKWLIERFQINNITAVSLTDLNTKPQNRLNVLAAAFTQGNYSFQVGSQQFDFSGLPFAGLEVETLAQTIPSTKKLLDKQFNSDIVLEMNDYAVIHLATHAAFTTGQPEESFILLGNGDRVTLRDIKNWRLPNVDLIVLSACQTGLGDQFGNGREILGFGYQIQQTGARAAIASLWSVDDGGTQVLMNAFYNILSQGKTTKAQALRQAQIALITGKYGNLTPQLSEHLSHPFYWSAFILIGNGL